jgi:hypothetical protein
MATLTEDAQVIVKGLQSQLNDGSHRLARSSCGFAVVRQSYGFWTMQGLSDEFPSDREQLDSESRAALREYGCEFREELEAIRSLLPPATEEDLAPWQKHQTLQSLKELYLDQAVHFKALRLWNEIGVPWRYRNGHVYSISTPSDHLTLEPRVAAADVRQFLIEIADRTAEDQVEIVRLTSRLGTWKVVAILTMFILFLIILSSVR